MDEPQGRGAKMQITSLWGRQWQWAYHWGAVWDV